MDDRVHRPDWRDASVDATRGRDMNGRRRANLAVAIPLLLMIIGCVLAMGLGLGWAAVN